MKDFRRRKRLKKGMVVLSLLLIIPLLLVIINTRSSFSVVKTNQLFFKESSIKEEYNEEKLSNHVRELSVTLLDSQGRIISSTNNEKEIDSIYQFSETTLPKKYITLEDTLVFLIEMNNFFDEEGNLLINNNTYYYLDIPSYIIPDDKAIVISEDGNEIELFKSGKAKAFGGIFKEGSTGYRFKIRFENLEEIKELNANFQFTSKLSNTIYNQVLDLKTLTFNDLGNLQFWLSKQEDQPEEEGPYTLTQTITEASSNDAYYLNTILTDNRTDSEELITEGKIQIDLGQAFGTSFYENGDFFSNISVYLNGQELSKNRSSNYDYFFYNTITAEGLRLDFYMKNTIDELVGSKCDPSTISKGYTCLANGFEVKISTFDGSAVKGIKEIKIVIKEKLITTLDGTYQNTASFIDYTGETSKLFSSISIEKKETEKPKLKTSLRVVETNNITGSNDFPMVFEHKVEISKSDSSFIELEVENNKYDYNGNDFNYFMSSACFNASHYPNCGYSDESPGLYIDDKYVSLSYEYSLSSIVTGQLSDADPHVQMRIKEIIGDDWNYYGQDTYYKASLWRSNSKNSDGDYYYILVSYENNKQTYDQQFGRGEFADYITNSSIYEQPSAPKMKIWILNAKNKAIKMTFQYRLVTISRSSSTTYSGGTLIDLTTRIRTNKYNDMRFSNYSSAYNRFMTVRGELLNENYIKWEVEISATEYMNYRLRNRQKNAEIIINLPPNLTFTMNDGYLYSEADKKMIPYYEVNTGNYNEQRILYPNEIYSCYVHDSNRKECSDWNYTKLSLEDGNFSDINLLFDRKSEIKAKIIKNMPYQEPMYFEFFTKINNYYEQSPSSWYSIDVQFMTVGTGAYSNYGAYVPILKYSAEGTVINDIARDGDKQTTSSYILDNKRIVKWTYNKQYYYVNEQTTYYHNESLPKNASLKHNVYYNGVYQFYDKMDGLSANYTKLRNIKIDADILTNSKKDNITISNEELNYFINYLGNTDYKECTDSGWCATISFYMDRCRGTLKNSASCLTSNYGENYLNELTKMSNGFAVMITGLRDTSFVNIEYETETDIIGLRNELTSNTGVLLDNKYYMLHNYLFKKEWYHSDPFNYQSNYLKSIYKSFEDNMLADVSISKNVKELAIDKYLPSDTVQNTLTAQIGYSAVSELDINDIIKSIGNSSLGTINDVEDIKELKKHLEIGNLSIKYYPGFSNYPVTIYSDNSFIDSWANSTITFDPNDNNLYALHLENTDKTLPMGSKFEITYDLTFDIDNYRNNDNYNGGYFYIIMDAEAIREYTPGPNEEEVTSTNPKNYIDYENHKLHVFNNATVYGRYLKPPTYLKKITSNDSNNNYYSEYTITTNFGSVGKEKKASLELIDELIYKFNTPPELVGTETESKINQLNELILANTKISKFEVSKKIDGDESNLYKHEEILEPGTYNFSKDGYSGTIKLHGNDHPNYLEITAKGFEYDEVLFIKYGTIVDFEKFYKEAINSNLLDSNLKIIGTDLVYEPTSTNIARDPVHEIESSASSGYISIKSSMPTINKSVEYPNETDTKWTVNVTTGYLNEVLKVTDLLDIQGSEAIKKSIITKDLQIKVNDTIVYENGSFVGDWDQNIKIDNLDFEFKNTDNNDFISENSNIEISYITHFDVDKYRINDGTKSDSYYINNEATLEKGYIKAKALATTKKIEFNYPLTISKTYVGNKDNNLEYTKWHYEVDSKELNRKNVIISDTSELSSDFGKYLSISNLSIKLVTADKEEEIYNHQANKNDLPQTIHITDIDGEELDFKKNGEYKFIIIIDTLAANTKLVVDYEFLIDREKYEYYEEPTDIELNINNNIKLDYDGETINTNDRGTSVISSPLSKKYRLINKSTTNVKMEWSIDINLDIDYPGELTDNDEVTITDQLFGGTTYEENSIKVYNLVLNGTSYGKDSLLTKDTDYTFVYEEDTVKVKLLHPNNNKNIRILFNTNSEAIPNSLKNYVSMSVNGKSTHISSEEVSGVFTTFIGGTVTSRGVTYFTIYANKYLDDKLTNKEFEFELEEVDYDGNELKDGIKLNAVNDENGKITFGPLKYSNEGIHYYKIKEKKGSERIEYDENVYTVKIKVVNFQNEYIIEESSIIGKGEDEEIEFYNKTLPPEPEQKEDQQTETDSDNKSNPNTADSIKIILIILIIIGIVVLLIKKFKPTKYSQVS